MSSGLSQPCNIDRNLYIIFINFHTVLWMKHIDIYSNNHKVTWCMSSLFNSGQTLGHSATSHESKFYLNSVFFTLQFCMMHLLPQIIFSIYFTSTQSTHLQNGVSKRCSCGSGTLLMLSCPLGYQQRLRIQYFMDLAVLENRLLGYTWWCLMYHVVLAI